MAIWHRPVTLDEVNDLCRNTLGEHLGIRFTEIGDDYLVARMPVDDRTRQPHGMLHGGASVALAETLGSVGGTLCVDGRTRMCAGLEINANHIRPVRDGEVVGTARHLYRGPTLQVWEIRICTERGKLVCTSRITLSVLNRRDKHSLSK